MQIRIVQRVVQLDISEPRCTRCVQINKQDRCIQFAILYYVVKHHSSSENVCRVVVLVELDVAARRIVAEMLDHPFCNATRQPFTSSPRRDYVRCTHRIDFEGKNRFYPVRCVRVPFSLRNEERDYAILR